MVRGIKIVGFSFCCFEKGRGGGGVRFRCSFLYFLHCYIWFNISYSHARCHAKGSSYCPKIKLMLIFLGNAVRFLGACQIRLSGAGNSAKSLLLSLNIKCPTKYHMSLADRAI